MQTQRKNTNRIEKVEALIQKEVGKILHNILDTELGLVTVSKVEASRDLRWAKVWVSIVGKDDNIVLMQCHASQQ
jgi:ribosome-binding factor A